MFKKALLQKVLINKNFTKINTIFNTKINSKPFSIYNSDREKKLSQFFKLPSINNLKEDQIFDKSEIPDVSVLNIQDDEIDKVDLMEKILKKKLFDEERKMKLFFKGNSDRESIKITENLIEKLRLNKEFKFSEDYKSKQILNEYGNYDKYFENYKIVVEKKPDLSDDGSNRWESKYRELHEKYNNPNSRVKTEKNRRIQLLKMIEDLNNYDTEFNFIDYLNFQEQFDQPDLRSTNPRDINENHLEDVDVGLLDRINTNKINYRDVKEDLFGVRGKEAEEESKNLNENDDSQNFDNNKPPFLNEKVDYNPIRDKDGNPYHTVNLITGPDEPQLEHNVREAVKTARNIKNKIEEIRAKTVEGEGSENGIEEEDPEIEKYFRNSMAR